MGQHCHTGPRNYKPCALEGPPYFVNAALPWSPQEFVAAAQAVQTHPFDEETFMPDELKRVVFDTLTLGADAILERQALELDKWVALIESLRAKKGGTVACVSAKTSPACSSR